MWNIALISSIHYYHILLRGWPTFHSVFNTPDEKAGEGEQKEETDNQLSEVATQAEECPPSTPPEDKETPQSQDTLEDEIPAEAQQPVSQPNPTRTHSGRGRPPKTASFVSQKKMSLKNEEEGVASDASGFQDNPSDADYTPSKYTFTESVLNYFFYVS